MASLDQNPAKGGTPAMANQPTMNVPPVTGIQCHRPPILFMSCSSCRPWITLPADRNSNALKNAWVKRWNTAAVHAPTPRAITM